MYQIVSVEDLKLWLAINDNSQLEFLNSLQKAITWLVESVTEKKMLTRSYTEYYSVEYVSESSLLLKNYPLYVTLASDQITNITLQEVDPARTIDASDYWVDVDVGKLVLRDDESVFTTGAGALKITYTAGYSRYLVLEDQNDYLDISNTNGTAAIQLDVKSELATFYPGYSAEDLATMIQAKLRADTTLNDSTFTVTYDHSQLKFKISSSNNFSLLCKTGANNYRSAWSLLGFSEAQDKTDANQYLSDNPVTGLPANITLACQLIADRLYSDNKRGVGKLDIISKNLQQGGTLSYVKDFMPVMAYEILKNYKKAAI